MSNIYIDGMYVSSVKTQYGEIIKLNIDIEKLKDFTEEHGVESFKNGRVYLNVDVRESKTGSKYACLNEWKPESSKASNDGGIQNNEGMRASDQRFDEDEIPL